MLLQLINFMHNKLTDKALLNIIVMESYMLADFSSTPILVFRGLPSLWIFFGALVALVRCGHHTVLSLALDNLNFLFRVRVFHFAWGALLYRVIFDIFGGDLIRNYQ